MKSLTTVNLARELYRALRKRHARWWEVRAADAMVVSFPKSGRTWLRYMLALIVEREGGKPVRFDNLLDPALPSFPRILFTHAGSDRYVKTALTLRPDEQLDKRVVFLSRDPRDVIVSYYFELTRRTPVYKGPLDDFLFDLDFGLPGIISFMNEWITLDGRESFHLLRYEELRADPLMQMKKLLRFLSVTEVGETLLNAVVCDASFRSMRQLEMTGKYGPRLRPGDSSDSESYKTRKGKVGGHREYLTEKQVALMDEKIRAELDSRFGY